MGDWLEHKQSLANQAGTNLRHIRHREPSQRNRLRRPASFKVFFARNGTFCGWPGRGERLLRAKLFQGGAGARNQVQSRAEYRWTLLSSSALSE